MLFRSTGLANGFAKVLGAATARFRYTQNGSDDQWQALRLESKEVKSARPPSAQGPHFKTKYVEQMPHKPTQGQPPSTAEKVDVVWSWVVWT